VGLQGTPTDALLTAIAAPSRADAALTQNDRLCSAAECDFSDKTPEKITSDNDKIQFNKKKT